MRGLLFFLMICISSLANSQRLSGRVLGDNETPLLGAHIFNSTNNKHTHTDENGYFKFENVELNNLLIVTYVGHRPHEIKVDSFEDVLIVLDYDQTQLDEVIISSGINVLNEIVKVDLQANPINSSQEILTYVPGLFIGQHAGGGKAEQIFLRGFDIDHGTDLAISVDNLPVNMVSHAHGQGYADLHFLIPETIEQIEFGKGPYYATQGNFNTAGYVNFKTKESLESNELKVELGDFNTSRVLGMFQLPSGDKSMGYIASEMIETDGPFETPQNFNRWNVFGVYTINSGNNKKIKLLGSHFMSQWDASGQIPIRAVKDGSITRFGAIDDTEGGRTSRQNLAVEWQNRINTISYLNTLIYYSHYVFELYSNFTFYLEDPINGDQIRQKESRNLFGFKSALDRSYHIGSANIDMQVGLEVRNDFIDDNELSFTRNRSETLRPLRFGDITESNKSLYFNTNLEIGSWEFSAGIRGDLISFNYTEKLSPRYEPKGFQILTINPKLSIQYNFSEGIQYYLKAGRGFHSNDARVTTENLEFGQTIPGAYGVDFGTNWKPIPNVFLNAALWYLELEQEFVYVGDAGIVEPSEATSRKGIDLTVRYELSESFFFNSDVTITKAQSSNVPSDENSIPLAPTFTFTSGLHIRSKSGWNGSISLRHLGDRPANETYSIIAEGYTIVDSSLGYKWNDLKFNLQVQNLFNNEWKETQFATESRLNLESKSVEEIHFTPGTPLFIKGSIQYSF